MRTCATVEVFLCLATCNCVEQLHFGCRKWWTFALCSEKFAYSDADSLKTLDLSLNCSHLHRTDVFFAIPFAGYRATWPSNWQVDCGRSTSAGARNCATPKRNPETPQTTQSLQTNPRLTHVSLYVYILYNQFVVDKKCRMLCQYMQ